MTHEFRVLWLLLLSFVVCASQAEGLKELAPAADAELLAMYVCSVRSRKLPQTQWGWCLHFHLGCCICPPPHITLRMHACLIATLTRPALQDDVDLVLSAVEADLSAEIEQEDTDGGGGGAKAGADDADADADADGATEPASPGPPATEDDGADGEAAAAADDDDEEAPEPSDGVRD